MSTLTLALANFWPGFTAEEATTRFPELFDAADFTLIEDPRAADVLLYSCFENGRKILRPTSPIPKEGNTVRVFYTAENIAPDFRECDFALSFSREILDPRHQRFPNSIGALRANGFGLDALDDPRPGGEAAREILDRKTRFCAYVQGHRVPFRESFVTALSRYRQVDCAGPSLNNTGFVVNRKEKYSLFAESKFAITFENEASAGYTTEKLPDALAVDCVPIYWGDPTVSLDFNDGAFIHVASQGDVEAAIEKVIALDQDDDAYLEMLRAARFPNAERPRDFRPDTAAQFFDRVVQAARVNRAARERPTPQRRGTRPYAASRDQSS